MITFRAQDDWFAVFLQICTKVNSTTLSSKCNLVSQAVVVADKSAFEIASVNLKKTFGMQKVNEDSFKKLSGRQLLHKQTEHKDRNVREATNH